MGLIEDRITKEIKCVYLTRIHDEIPWLIPLINNPKLTTEFNNKMFSIVKNIIEVTISDAIVHQLNFEAESMKTFKLSKN